MQHANNLPRSSPTRFSQQLVSAASKGIDWLHIVRVKAFIDLKFPDRGRAGAVVFSLTRGKQRFRDEYVGRVGEWANGRPALWLAFD